MEVAQGVVHVLARSRRCVEALVGFGTCGSVAQGRKSRIPRVFWPYPAVEVEQAVVARRPAVVPVSITYRSTTGNHRTGFDLRLVPPVIYNASMAGVVTAKVSQRGQTSLPAELRHRWGIADGGEIAFIDLGDAALILPGGMGAAMAEVRRLLAAGAYGEGLAAVDDPDLAV